MSPGRRGARSRQLARWPSCSRLFWLQTPTTRNRGCSRVSEAQLDLFADPERNIGSIDPFLREMYTGLGCALENAVLTARALGYRPQVELLPDPRAFSACSPYRADAGGRAPLQALRRHPEPPYEPRRLRRASGFT